VLFIGQGKKWVVLKAFVRWMGNKIKACASFELFAKNEAFIL